MKREHGEEEPTGANSVTAPATVSGEQPVMTTGHGPGKGQHALIREVRRPAILDRNQPGGGPVEDKMTDISGVSRCRCLPPTKGQRWTLIYT
ncbi:hypothetical protein GCM10016455_28370 [Aliiroseovarius zhejiangensis]|uniref:Uncharacterized protein n=1 Tax=Aliiroseovarius zhejiangensis TaxID=1632025 RepID=A0ABQ3J663_9RHOB|nr:hypothetical protein GCM10016455_28370 [Aliiroseovarius zhejiangensis]